MSSMDALSSPRPTSTAGRVSHRPAGRADARHVRAFRPPIAWRGCRLGLRPQLREMRWLKWASRVGQVGRSGWTSLRVWSSGCLCAMSRGCRPGTPGCRTACPTSLATSAKDPQRPLTSGSVVGPLPLRHLERTGSDLGPARWHAVAHARRRVVAVRPRAAGARRQAFRRGTTLGH